MYEAMPMLSIEPKVFLLTSTPDPLGAVAAAFRMYAGKPTYSMGDITDDERQWAWEESLRTHLKAPWEFIDLHFFIEGVTRAWTHQMVRQRTAVYAQESLRFAVKKGLAKEIPLPPSLVGRHPEDPPVIFWKQACERIEETYNTLINAGIPAEDARGLLPHATTTRMNYKTNFRGLIEHAGNRLCTQAQFEWRKVFLGIMEAIKNHNTAYVSADGPGPADWQWQILAKPIAQTFTPVCYKAGKCVFMGDLDRLCTIRERVNEGRFGEIDPAEWMADHTAARPRA